MSDRNRPDEDELEPEKVEQDLVRVQDVTDEASGTMLTDFLRSEGIQATLRRVEISMLPGVESMSHGYWGYVDVLERDAAQARALIREFMAQSTGGAARNPKAGGDEPEDAA